MKISLLTDAPRHNLALMKISAVHKARGDQVLLNCPIEPADKSYASWLFRTRYAANVMGGPGYDPTIRLPDVFEVKPDYDLFKRDYSLGYTWEYCPRQCGFCVVPKQDNPKVHYSIWDFHDSRFKKICLLNNNTFSDPRWRETFKEIWDADLEVRDENGYDLRLLDDEKTDALHRTKWDTPLHFAWDCIDDESTIRRGLKLLEKHHLRSTSNGVYVLIGFDTTEEQDIYRCQVIDDHGLTPYPMPYVRNRYTRRFKRFVNLHYYREYESIEAAWGHYDGGK